MSTYTLADALSAATPKKSQAAKKLRFDTPRPSALVDDQTDAEFLEALRKEAPASWALYNPEEPMPQELKDLLPVVAITARSESATIVLECDGIESKGCFIAHDTIRSTAHGFIHTFSHSGDYVEFSVNGKPTAGYVYRVSSRDIVDIIVSPVIITAEKVKILPLGQTPPDVFTGFSEKGAERFTRIAPFTWKNESTLWKEGDSGTPVMDERGQWVLCFRGIDTRDGSRIFTRCCTNPDELTMLLAADEEPLVSCKGRSQRGVKRMSAAEYEKRRANAERHAGRVLTSRELNSYFFHDMRTQDFVDFQETGSDRYLHMSDGDVEEIHSVVSMETYGSDYGADGWEREDESPRIERQGRGGYDHALGMTVNEFLGLSQSKFKNAMLKRARDTGNPDDAMDAEDSKEAQPSSPPLFPVPAFLPQTLAELWALCVTQEEQLAILMDFCHIAEISRPLYMRLTPEKRYATLCSLREKAPTTGAGPAIPKPPTRKDAAATARAVTVAALKARRQELNEAGFRLRASISLNESEMKEFPAVTHEEMLLRKEIKTLEHAKSAKASFERINKEKEKAAAKAQATIERLTAQISALKEQMDVVDGENF